ncbi:hypothetical protein NKH85_28615 [Mesorhizobium sp. M0924]|uniref:hypothetical protein n=1 Tax=unclassified Mesorhizobium TaxID=325217 RepID=UPI00333B02FA
MFLHPRRDACPSWGERVDFADDGGLVTVILACWHDRESAVAGTKDDDGYHGVAVRLKAKACASARDIDPAPV